MSIHTHAPLTQHHLTSHTHTTRTHTSQLVTALVKENRLFEGKVVGLSNQVRSANKEAKTTLKAHKGKLKQITSERDKTYKAIQDLQNKLADKESLIRAISSTHRSCQDILSDYVNLQKRVVNKDNVIGDLRKRVGDQASKNSELR